jgi:hypothetical protein
MKNDSSSQYQGPERRLKPHLREIFDDVNKRLAHYLHEQGEWAGSSIDFLALRIVHENYPELSPDEVREVVTAIGHRGPGRPHELTA